MRIHVVSVGKIGAPYLREGTETYLKRLRPYARVEWTQVPDEPLPEPLHAAAAHRVRELEGERILAALPRQAYLVVLSRQGRQLTSEGLARHLAALGVGGTGVTAWVIGGTLGVAQAVMERANLLLSLSSLTFPHQMVPMLLAEQLYRAFRIQRGEPYHHTGAL